MKSLDCHLSEVLLYAEVGEFVVGHDIIVVPVVSEHVASHIGQFVLVFSQQAN
jgi:hypothetical protein